MPSGIIVLRWVYTLAIANLCNYTKNLSFKCMCAIMFILDDQEDFFTIKSNRHCQKTTMHCFKA